MIDAEKIQKVIEGVAAVGDLLEQSKTADIGLGEGAGAALVAHAAVTLERAVVAAESIAKSLEKIAIHLDEQRGAKVE